MMDFAARFASCRLKVQEIYSSLKDRSMDGVDIGPQPDALGWNFCVKFEGTGYSLSISVPPDMTFGYCETALVSVNDIIYRDDWGYSDVARFGDIDELVEEIKRLGRLMRADVKDRLMRADGKEHEENEYVQHPWMTVKGKCDKHVKNEK